MTDRDALYRAIIANPAEDTPRFVFADWLEEHDEPEHAEFIRIGCQLEANTPDHPDYAEWLTRQDELTCWLATHTEVEKLKFAAGLGVSDGEGWWRHTRRGFPRNLDFDGTHTSNTGTAAIRALAASLEKAFEKLPTRWLAVRFITNDQLAELLRQPVLSQLDALTLQLYADGEPNDEAAQLVAACPHLKNLRGFHVAFDFGEVGAEALSRSEYLQQLERFTLYHDWRVPTGKWFPNLRELTLVEGITAESFEQLCAHDPFSKLHTLHLSRWELPQSCWEAFAKSKSFPALTRLCLTRTHLGDGNMATLTGAKWFRPAHLDLDNCRMDNAGAEALAATPLLDSLRWLGLRNAGLTAKGVSAIASSKRVGNLRHLDLANNSVGARGLNAIATNPALRSLLVLNLSHALEGVVSPVHEASFLSRLNMPHLRSLSLRGRRFGAKVARLLTNPKFASLTRLDLGNCRLTDASVKALLEAPALQNLVELRLDGNDLKTGLEPLLDPSVMPRLGACYLHDNKLGGSLEEKLRARPGMKP